MDEITHESETLTAITRAVREFRGKRSEYLDIDYTIERALDTFLGTLDDILSSDETMLSRELRVHGRVIFLLDGLVQVCKARGITSNLLTEAESVAEMWRCGPYISCREQNTVDDEVIPLLRRLKSILHDCNGSPDIIIGIEEIDKFITEH